MAAWTGALEGEKNRQRLRTFSPGSGNDLPCPVNPTGGTASTSRRALLRIARRARIMQLRLAQLPFSQQQLVVNRVGSDALLVADQRLVRHGSAPNGASREERQTRHFRRGLRLLPSLAKAGQLQSAVGGRGAGLPQVTGDHRYLPFRPPQATARSSRANWRQLSVPLSPAAWWTGARR